MIDPEVALKACQEVLLQVQLQNREGPDQQQQQQVNNNNTDQTEGASPQWDAGSIREEEEEGEEEEEEEEEGEKRGAVREISQSSSSSAAAAAASKQSWLLRLFESKLFDVSMAIAYLYKSKEPGVQAYIGNRLFSFPDSEVDFYLPQLLNMYVHMDTEVGDAISPYLVSPGTPLHANGTARQRHSTPTPPYANAAARQRRRTPQHAYAAARRLHHCTTPPHAAARSLLV